MLFSRGGGCVILRCASQYVTCSCLGHMRYGKEPAWTAWQTELGSVECNDGQFGDPPPYLTPPTGSRPKAAMPHPAVWFIAPAACVSVRPPAIWVIAPCASPPAATPDFGETFEFPALRAVCAERLLLVGHSSKWLQNGSPRPSMVQSRSRRQRHHHHHHHHHHRTPQRRAPPPLSRPARRLTGARSLLLLNLVPPEAAQRSKQRSSKTWTVLCVLSP